MTSHDLKLQVVLGEHLGKGYLPPVAGVLLSTKGLQLSRDEEGSQDPQEGTGGDPQLAEEGLHQLVPRRAQLPHPVSGKRCQGLQEHGLLQDDDLPQTGKLNFTAQSQLACATH